MQVSLKFTKFISTIFLLLFLVACGKAASSNSNAPSTTNSGRNLKFYVVTQGQASEQFWSVLKRGADQAAKDMGVQVVYEAPPTFDLVALSKLIDAAVAAHADGLVVSIPDPNALKNSIKRAVAAGIPVISINSGADVAKSLGVLTYVGQTEYQAGFSGGQKMATLGVKHALCVIHDIGNTDQSLRCQGFKDAMKAGKARVDQVAVDANNPTQIQQSMEAKLQQDSSIDGVLTLGSKTATPALIALQDANKTGQVKLATFDLSSDILQAIKSERILFAIDQQQYLQGYLPIVLLTLYKTNLNTIANDVLQTGPGFVTSANVTQVIQLTAQGTR